MHCSIRPHQTRPCVTRLSISGGRYPQPERAWIRLSSRSVNTTERLFHVARSSSIDIFGSKLARMSAAAWQPSLFSVIVVRRPSSATTHFRRLRSFCATYPTSSGGVSRVTHKSRRYCSVAWPLTADMQDRDGARHYFLTHCTAP